ncbi:MAG: hypothetical protein Q7V56_16700 [Gammaproteobacteria bacterium]|nr:hypothetical protein [Gammaproteobacteria bacterium]
MRRSLHCPGSWGSRLSRYAAIGYSQRRRSFRIHRKTKRSYIPEADRHASGARSLLDFASLIHSSGLLPP